MLYDRKKVPIVPVSSDDSSTSHTNANPAKQTTLMKTRWIVICVLTALCGKAAAQSRDIGLQVGLNVPMSDKSMIGSDVTLGVSYGQFHYNGLGFRAGFQYAASTASINDVFGVPVAFAYRTRSKSTQERFESGIIGAWNAGGWHSGSDPRLRLFHGMHQRTEPPLAGLNLKRSVRFPELPGFHAILDFIELLLHFNGIPGIVEIVSLEFASLIGAGDWPVLLGELDTFVMHGEETG